MVKAWKEKVVIPTYEVGKPEKNPIFLEKRVYQGSSGVVYPYPVIESMACKVPIITTGYYPSNEDNAFIVSIKDIKAIENAVLELINKPSIKKQELAYQQIQSFSWENIAQKMMNYFNE